MLQNDELLDRICYLERANRFWKRMTFGLGAAVVLLFALGTGLGLSLYFQAQDQRVAAEEARQQEAIAREQAEMAAERAQQKAMELPRKAPKKG
jgi:hypothetical protein